MNTLCPHLFISKSLLKSLPAHFDIINWTLDIFRNRDFSVVANFLGYTEKGPLKNNLSYIYIVYTAVAFGRGESSWIILSKSRNVLPADVFCRLCYLL